jgi:group I intron endonuclease
MDYSKSIIYKICCNDVSITDVYVGSTTNLTKRKNKHKSCCNNSNDKSYDTYKYQFIRENEGWDNWSVIVVEEFNCESKFQLETRERYWLEQLKATLNKCIPTRTTQENNKDYYANNKDKINERKKEHYENNKDKMKEKVKCEVCDCEVRKGDFTKHKKTQKHKDNMDKLE